MDPTPPTPPVPKRNEKSTKMIVVDLVNNTRAMQSIDAGDEAHTRIVIAPGETKSRVQLAEWVAKELRQRSRSNSHVSHQLVVYEAGKAPAPKSNEDEDDGEDDED